MLGLVVFRVLSRRVFAAASQVVAALGVAKLRRGKNSIRGDYSHSFCRLMALEDASFLVRRANRRRQNGAANCPIKSTSTVPAPCEAKSLAGTQRRRDAEPAQAHSRPGWLVVVSNFQRTIVAQLRRVIGPRRGRRKWPRTPHGGWASRADSRQRILYRRLYATAAEASRVGFGHRAVRCGWRGMREGALISADLH